MNTAVTRRAKAIGDQDLAARARIDQRIAHAIIGKTGGHLALSLQLANHARAYPEDFGAAFRSWAGAAEPMIIRVIEDYGTAGRGIILDLLRARGAVDELTLLRHRFGGDVAAGLECLRDLESSGLVARDEGGRYRLNASMVSALDGVATRLKIPPPVVPIDESSRHADAAALLYRLENGLRLLVVEALRQTGNDWWNQKVPAAIAAEAESLGLQERDSRSAPPEELHPVMYLPLGPLHDLLIHEDVWARLTTTTALDRTTFDTLWRDFTLLRNKVAHNRPATDGDVALLQEVADRFKLE